MSEKVGVTGIIFPEVTSVTTSVVVVGPRTDEEYRLACVAYGNLRDALKRVFWWTEWKLRTFGSASISRKQWELEEAVEKYVKARIASDRVVREVL